MKFAQFRLHPVILNYNYFVYNSVAALINCWFFSSLNSTGRGRGRGRGSLFFKNANAHKNVIIEWSLTTLYYKMRQVLLQNATGIITICDRSLLQNTSRFLLQNATFITNCESAMRNMLQRYMFPVFTQLSIHYRCHFTFSYQLIYSFQEI